MRHVVLVLPPAVERAGKAWELMDARAVIVCADHEQAALWADAVGGRSRKELLTYKSAVSSDPSLARIFSRVSAALGLAGACVQPVEMVSGDAQRDDAGPLPGHLGHAQAVPEVAQDGLTEPEEDDQL